jgi:hypothetical protein
VLRLDAAQERWRAQAARARQSYDEQLWDAAEGRYRLGPARREVFADCLHFFYDAVSKLDAFDTTACGAR